jgi:1,4-alpha-glucan branching enzyme
VVTIELDGRITFTIDAPAAQSVDVVGALTGWTEQRHPMTRDPEGRWRLVLDPAEGEHLFRYLIDGDAWCLDPEAHGTVTGADGIERSRLWRPPLEQDPDAIAA